MQRSVNPRSVTSVKHRIFIASVGEEEWLDEKQGPVHRWKASVLSVYTTFVSVCTHGRTLGSAVERRIFSKIFFEENPHLTADPSIPAVCAHKCERSVHGEHRRFSPVYRSLLLNLRLYVMGCKIISMKPTLYNYLVILMYHQNMFKIPHALKPTTLFTSNFVLNNLVIWSSCIH